MLFQLVSGRSIHLESDLVFFISMDIPREAQSTNKTPQLDGHDYTFFFAFSSNSTNESVSDISGTGKNTYSFNKEIDIQDTYDNFYEDALKLNK